MGTRSKARVVVVSGGGSGIGLAIARKFARAGESIVLLGRNESRLEKAVAEIGSGEYHRIDLSDRREVAALAETIGKRHGTVDVLVNSAGILRTVSLDMPLDEAEAVWDDVMGSSLKAPFLLSHAVSHLLASPGGRIVNIGSIVVQSGGSASGFLAYTPAKSGVHGLTYALARELAPRRITVNTIAPGFIEGTGMTGDWRTGRTSPIIAQIPLGRPGAPDDIANAVAWFASPEADYVTGATLSVNGGWRFS